MTTHPGQGAAAPRYRVHPELTRQIRKILSNQGVLVIVGVNGSFVLLQEDRLPRLLGRSVRAAQEQIRRIALRVSTLRHPWSSFDTARRPTPANCVAAAEPPN